MGIDKQKLDSFSAWHEASKTYSSELKKVISGERENDLAAMKAMADKLNMLFNVYRKDWGID